MPDQLHRRDFLGAAGIGLAARGAFGGPADTKPVRLGVIGTGVRGRNLLQIALSIGGVDVPALCDIDKEHLAKAHDMVETALRRKPEGYLGEEAYKRLVARDDLDAVLIATPWHWHTPMAVASMKSGKYTGVEVPAAITFENCWDLVNTQEQTGTPCMMMENWSFRRDNLAVLKMIRAGMFGEINHCHCAHSHDCTDSWYFDFKTGEPTTFGEYLLKRNADQYPTHALGPVISWMDINCGDYPVSLTSTATRSISLAHHFAKRFGPEHPAAKRKYVQADIVTSVIRTAKGNTIVVNNDMQSPRPYDNRWEISGTDGVYNEQRNALYIAEVSPPHALAIPRGSRGEQWESFGPYQEKYDHSWYKSLTADTGRNALDRNIGHGGPDYIELKLFLDAVRTRTALPLDIYDSVVMCAVIPLSEKSIADRNAPVPFPDFTRGKWKTKKPYFAVET